jgi:hypothetical protein
MSSQYSFQHKSGDTWDGLTVRLVRNDSPVDLSGATIRMQVRRTRCMPPILDISTASGITVTDAANGEFRINPTIITANTFGPHDYDIEITFTDGTVRTWVSGVIDIVEDVTYV